MGLLKIDVNRKEDKQEYVAQHINFGEKRCNRLVMFGVIYEKKE